jgi:hypothetical protein
MPTEAQNRANQQNAQHSTGPKSDETKAISSMNNFKYGLTGTKFYILPDEDYDEFDHVLMGLRYEHKPATMTESILVEKMARSYWLSLRALKLRNSVLADDELTSDEQHKQLSLYIRYQTTHDRAFRAALTDLLKLRAERRKLEIGFESQKRQEALVALRQSAENRRLDEAARSQRAEDRKIERHKWDVLLAEAKMNHQMVLTSNLELDREIAAAAGNHPQEAQIAA